MRYVFESRESKFHTVMAVGHHADTYGVLDNLNRPVLAPNENGKLVPLKIVRSVPMRVKRKKSN